MSAGRTMKVMARPKGFEPLTPRFVVWCSIQLSYGRARGCDKSSPQTSIAAIRKRDRYLMKTRAKSKRARAKTLSFRQSAAGRAENRSKTEVGRLRFICCSQDHTALPAASRSIFAEPQTSSHVLPCRASRRTGVRFAWQGSKQACTFSRAVSRGTPDSRGLTAKARARSSIAQQGLVAGPTGPVCQTAPVKRFAA